MKYEEDFEAFDDRVNKYLQQLTDAQHYEIVSVTPAVTNSVEGVDYFITIVYNK